MCSVGIGVQLLDVLSWLWDLDEFGGASKPCIACKFVPDELDK
jgi:hypothetical protein